MIRTLTVEDTAKLVHCLKALEQTMRQAEFAIKWKNDEVITANSVNQLWHLFVDTDKGSNQNERRS
jgi:hypothetical protein